MAFYALGVVFWFLQLLSHFIGRGRTPRQWILGVIVVALWPILAPVAVLWLLASFVWSVVTNRWTLLGR